MVTFDGLTWVFGGEVTGEVGVVTSILGGAGFVSGLGISGATVGVIEYGTVISGFVTAGTAGAVGAVMAGATGAVTAGTVVGGVVTAGTVVAGVVTTGVVGVVAGADVDVEDDVVTLGTWLEDVVTTVVVVVVVVVPGAFGYAGVVVVVSGFTRAAGFGFGLGAD